MSTLRLSVGVLAFIGLTLLNFTQSESCLLSKALASGSAINSSVHSSVESMWESQWNSNNFSSDSSFNTTGDSSGGDGVDHGNFPELACPIWEITLVIKDEWENMSCKTPGSYKCVDETCPHGV